MSVFDCWPVTPGKGGAWISQEIFTRNSWEVNPHQGLDIAAAGGTPIVAPCDGFIVWASFSPFPPGNTWEMIAGNPGSGGCTILQPLAPHTAIQTSFSHQSRIIVTPGQFVRAGQVIGYVGTTGNSSGNHLHWEAFIDYAEGVYPPGTFYGRVDPRHYMKGASSGGIITTGGKGDRPLLIPDTAEYGPGIPDLFADE